MLGYIINTHLTSIYSAQRKFLILEFLAIILITHRNSFNMKLTSIVPLLASLTTATPTLKKSEFSSLSKSSVSAVIAPTTLAGAGVPSLVQRAPLLNINPSMLNIVGESILTVPTTLATKVPASDPTKLAATIPAITNSSSDLVPTLAERALRRPKDKVKNNILPSLRLPFSAPGNKMTQ